MSSTRKELADRLKQIYYNKDFVCGVISILHTESAMKVMLDYIDTANELAEDISSDELILLALHLRDQEDDKGNKEKRKIVAAML